MAYNVFDHKDEYYQYDDFRPDSNPSGYQNDYNMILDKVNNGEYVPSETYPGGVNISIGGGGSGGACWYISSSTGSYTRKMVAWYPDYTLGIYVQMYTTVTRYYSYSNHGSNITGADYRNGGYDYRFNGDLRINAWWSSRVNLNDYDAVDFYAVAAYDAAINSYYTEEWVKENGYRVCTLEKKSETKVVRKYFNANSQTYKDLVSSGRESKIVENDSKGVNSGHYEQYYADIEQTVYTSTIPNSASGTWGSATISGSKVSFTFNPSAVFYLRPESRVAICMFPRKWGSTDKSQVLMQGVCKFNKTAGTPAKSLSITGKTDMQENVAICVGEKAYVDFTSGVSGSQLIYGYKLSRSDGTVVAEYGHSSDNKRTREEAEILPGVPGSTVVYNLETYETSYPPMASGINTEGHLEKPTSEGRKIGSTSVAVYLRGGVAYVHSKSKGWLRGGVFVYVDGEWKRTQALWVRHDGEWGRS